MARTVDVTLEVPSARWLLSDFAQHQLGRALKTRGLLLEAETLPDVPG